MDRKIIYPGQIPLETDLLGTNKNMMIALAKLSSAILGTATQLNGLACAPNSPAALNVIVGAGEVYSLQNVDGTAYSSIAADTTNSILKQGILLDAVTLACPAPGTPGQSIAYLVQVAYQDTDTDAVVLPYYNASNPSQAYSGPANAGTTNNTVRKGLCIVSVKAGIAATTGTQVAPAPDAGYTGAYVVTVANGQTTITAPNITTASGAPFITERLSDKIGQASADARYAALAGLATQAFNVAAASSTNQAVNLGQFIGANQSLVANGYQKFPGGLIVQWGFVNLTASSGALTFPITFPNACLHFSSQAIDGAGAAYASPTALPTTSGVVDVRRVPACGYHWLAIGY